ncbi:hypothetical protein N9059_01545 [bacterium]|nr:hypothetical protein [bacterium]
MKTIVCDASPLIFLAKINGLNLISEVLEGEIFILKTIVNEVCSETAGEIELMRIHRFLKSVTVIDSSDPNYPSLSLSENDRSVLNWSIKNKVDWLVADEKLLRRIAKEEGLNVVGIFGILIAAKQQKLRTLEETKSMIDDLVSKHDCRMSIALYQKVLNAIEE